MTDTEKIAFKNRLKRWALDLITERINTARAVIDAAQEAANNEEKSSAGDKYETGRAMGHLQQEMHAKQLTEYVKELSILHSVNTDILYNEGRAGAFLKGTDQSFFIAAGLGKQTLEGQMIFFLSPHAPLAKILQNKKAGDNITFNSIKTTIQMVF
ncbi:MAG: hypothetical protein JST68_20100 [Bacteroidetes bacterium]|nr:hypothetical protein [Bacteroidota bacterium]